ncbi:hypothetical protein Ancab_009144 [Ancistrocladus abbreviatus]
MGYSLPSFFEDPEFGESSLAGGSPSPEDLFSILDALEGGVCEVPLKTPVKEVLVDHDFELPYPSSPPKSKRQKTMVHEGNEKNNSADGQQRMSHITVERNRRKQMNEHLSVLRSLMPCFYVKRGDQASIIGGVVDYINELQQVLQSLEAKKQRKVYSEVLSPRLVSSPRPSPLSPRKPPLSPRLNLPISPRTPQPGSPYRPAARLQPLAAAGGYLSPTRATPLELSPSSSSTTTSSILDRHVNNNDLVANSKSSVAEVEVKFSGPNVLLKTISPKIPGQVVKIISALNDLSLEILRLNVSAIDETMLHSFTIKIGIECKLSAEELAHQIHQTFC